MVERGTDRGQSTKAVVESGQTMAECSVKEADVD